MCGILFEYFYHTLVSHIFPMTICNAMFVNMSRAIDIEVDHPCQKVQYSLDVFPREVPQSI